MFTRQYYYLQAVKNLMDVYKYESNSNYIPSAEDITAIAAKNLTGTVLSSNYMFPTARELSSKYAGFAYAVSLACNSEYSISRPYYVDERNNYSRGSIIVIGTGNTAPSLNDYKLESIVSTGLTKAVAHSAMYYDDDEDQWYVTETAVFTRSVETPVTIKEWGIYATINDDAAANMCVYRALLDSPVTLNAGDSLRLQVKFAIDAHMQ